MSAPEYRPHEVEWTPEKVGRVWAFYSQPHLRKLYFGGAVGAAIVDRVAATVPLDGRRVLDFGCGRGDLLEQLYERGIPAAGLEFSEETAADARQRFASQPLSVSYTHLRAHET